MDLFEAILKNKMAFSPVSKVSVKEIRRVIDEVKPDAIHAHDMKASFVAALACGKTPLISHIHNNNTNSRKLSIKSILYLLAAIKAKHIFGYPIHRSMDTVFITS